MDAPSVEPPMELSHGWGAPLISVFSLVLLAVMIFVAYWLRSDSVLNLLAGVVAANATSVVNYYVGSSRSSQTKDAVIAARLAPPPQPVLPFH